RLRVSHAFHSAHMDPVLDGFAAAIDGIDFRQPRIPLVSNLTGRPAEERIGTPEYWSAHIRGTVRFADTMTWLDEQGVSAFLELGPDAVLTAMALADSDRHAVPALRAGQDERACLLTAMGSLHTGGVPVDWASVFAPYRPHRTELPTHAFQRQRYWPDMTEARAGDLTATGLGAAHHPVLGAVVSLADGTTVLTGRMSARTLPDTTAGPAAVFLDLALRAADEVGCDRVDELTLHTPLSLPDIGSVQIQVTVGPADTAGVRPLTVHSRPNGSAPWQPHAEGAVGPDADDARPYAVRPSDDGETVAEVALPGGRDATGHGLHPALLAEALRVLVAQESGALQPFAFGGVRLHATGATRLRVRCTPVGDGRFAVEAADHTGAPVLSVESLVLRPEGAAAPVARPGALFHAQWTPLPVTRDEAGGACVLLGTVAPQLGAGLTEAGVRVTVADGPDALPDTADVVLLDHRHQEADWAEPRSTLDTLRSTVDALLTRTRRVVLTAGGAADGPDLATASVRGVARALRAANPGRVVFADVDDTPASAVALAHLLDGAEPEVVIRGGETAVPRMVPTAAPDAAPPPPTTGTVMVVGSVTGAGGLLVRHLATAHGHRRLMLVDPEATAAEPPGIPGTQVEVIVADMADREMAAKALDAADVGAVVYAVEPHPDPERSGARVDGARQLHELATGATPFVLCTSSAGLLGAAEPGGDPVGDAVLEALADQRRATGGPAAVVAWGGWAGWGAGQVSRGFSPLGDAEALAAFDAAVSGVAPVLVPALPDLAALRGADDIPAPLRGLVRPARRTAATGRVAVAERLSVLAGGAERTAALVDVVRSAAADVLGHADPEAIEPDRDFLEFGFDSLTLVQLRNRLAEVTGIRFEAATLFDRSSPAALARYLDDRLGGAHDAPDNDSVAKPQNAVAHLFLHACAQGKFDDANAIVQAVAKLQPSFSSAAEVAEPPRVIRLATGQARPRIVCLPSFSPASGPHEYAHLAAGLAGLRDVGVLPLPGFLTGQALPSTLDALMDVLGAAVLDHADGEPLVLLGRSAGGLIAHALAGHLERCGHGPAAVLMLDTYFSDRIDADFHDLVGPAMMGRENEATLLSDTRVIAMGGYQRVVAEWAPARLASPTLLVRAAEPFSEQLREAQDHWQADVDVPHTTIDVPGNHFTILEECAQSTALAVHTWLSTTI
ncbi:thioesterase domain-containing protein, partial [Streptomyces antioxidans]|uniref:thioesterase domain-containing protein n=1 Tax=Streptomyces antioxidans TaxID=1507734 RepID=UPI00117D46BB